MCLRGDAKHLLMLEKWIEIVKSDDVKVDLFIVSYNENTLLKFSTQYFSPTKKIKA